jgi:tryptophanyl-tRNA synthetase
MNKEIVISGMRPTGRIHLGNYNSVIKNWIKLQDIYQCFFFIADIHALTTDINNLEKINFYTKKIIAEWLASGIKYKKCKIFIQSHILETFELHTLLSMITPIPWLERIPSYKNEKNNINTYGFLGYPVLQGADIIIINAKYVPIGEDQLPHLEIIREIVRKLNFLLKKDSNNKLLINEPLPLLNKHKNIIGLDGTKMSKSKNNTILISDTSEILEKKIKKIITDPKRIFKNIPGDPNNCSVWTFHLIYSKKNEKEYINNACKTANIGCVECKNMLFQNIEKRNNIIVEKIKIYDKKEKKINNILIEGAETTRALAKKVLNNIKSSLNFS